MTLLRHVMQHICYYMYVLYYLLYPKKAYACHHCGCHNDGVLGTSRIHVLIELSTWCHTNETAHEGSSAWWKDSVLVATFTFWFHFCNILKMNIFTTPSLGCLSLTQLWQVRRHLQVNPVPSCLSRFRHLWRSMAGLYDLTWPSIVSRMQLPRNPNDPPKPLDSVIGSSFLLAGLQLLLKERQAGIQPMKGISCSAIKAPAWKLAGCRGWWGKSDCRVSARLKPPKTLLSFDLGSFSTQSRGR